MTFKLTLHIVAENSSSCNFKEASRLGRLSWLMQISLFYIPPKAIWEHYEFNYCTNLLTSYHLRPKIRIRIYSLDMYNGEVKSVMVKVPEVDVLTKWIKAGKKYIYIKKTGEK